MPKLHEIIDSLNDEVVSAEVKEQLKTEANALHESNKQLYNRAKKAEGFEQKDGKWVKAEKKPEPKPENPEASQSNEPDYSEKIDKLTLKSEGITHSDDVKVVLNEAKRLKLSVEEVAGMEHIKARLKTLKDQREAESGMPTGSGKTSGTSKNSVEHWINKKNPDGTFATPDDLELAEKVIDARVKKEEARNKFSDELYSG